MSILLPFAPWLLMAYFETIPHEIDEAAHVDAASHFTMLVRFIRHIVRGLAAGAVDG